MTRRLLVTCLALAALLVPALRIAPAVHADTRSHISSGGLSGYRQTIGAPAPAAKSADPPAPTNAGTLHPVVGSTYAGTWIIYSQITCTRTAENAGVCDVLLGPGNITAFQNGINTHCNASGSYCPYTSFFNAVANAPGLPYECDNNVFVNDYNGDCLENERGVLDVMPSGLGIPGFFILTEYASYSTNPPTVNVFDPAGMANYPLDLAVPAVPGFYDTRYFLEHFGLIAPGGHIPAGVSATMTVQHVTYWQ